MISIIDNFDSGSLDYTKWETGAKNSGANVSIVNNKLKMVAASDWDGCYVRTKKGLTKNDMIKKLTTIQFDLLVTDPTAPGNVLPYFGIVAATSGRETTYCYSANDGKNIVFQINSTTSISLGVRSNNNLNTTNFVTVSTGFNLSATTNFKIVLTNNKLDLYINNSNTPAISYTIPASVLNVLLDDNRFEFYDGNYGSTGHYVLIDNYSETIIDSKMLFTDNTNLYTLQNSLVSILHSKPSLLSDYNSYGLISVTPSNVIELKKLGVFRVIKNKKI
jgi:hypothetical protein